jgi:hypothetical protein
LHVIHLAVTVSLSLCPKLRALISTLYAVFPISWLYDRLFRPSVETAIDQYFVQDSSRKAFHAALARYLDTHYKDILAGHYSTTVHARTLNALQCYLKDTKTNSTCLSCIVGTCGKVLGCGHAICDTCVRTFAVRSSSKSNTFLLAGCPLCGGENRKPAFRLTPPTAGVRALSLDGGGIKGIIPLMVLQSLENELAFLDVPLHDHFDFVAGTSAGGLIAIGLFLMGWSTTECIAKFEDISAQTFASTDTVNPLRRIRQLVIAFIRDWKHSSTAIADAFKSDTSIDVKMFNPLVSDTKVAVTSNTTAALKPEPCVFSNYNHNTPALDDSK